MATGSNVVECLLSYGLPDVSGDTYTNSRMLYVCFGGRGGGRYCSYITLIMYCTVSTLFSRFFG